MLGSAHAWAAEGSCDIGAGQSCWQARANCEQRRAEAAAQKAAALEQELQSAPPLVRDTVLFKTDSAQPVEETNEMSSLVSTIKKVPNAHVRVEGYADNRGTEEYNQALSLRRAEAVKQQLMEQGIDKNQIQTSALGETSPVADNATIEGRALNRRAEIMVQSGSAVGAGVSGGASGAGVGAGVQTPVGDVGAGVSTGSTAPSAPMNPPLPPPPPSP